jgi:hypothetical protein
MPKKICLGLAVSLMSILPAQAALGATITLNPTCTFAKAVTWINAGFGSQSGCTKSGTFGSNDTIIVGLDHQAFNITSTVEIKKSLTVTNWWNYGYLNVTSASVSPAIKIAAPDISVNFNYIILSGAPNNSTTGILVEGRNPAVDITIPKLTMLGGRITGFRRSGMRINQATVMMSNMTLDYNRNDSTIMGDGGGAVKIESSGATPGRLEADYCWFVGNTAKRGGAIFNHGVLNVKDTYFANNVATRSGGGGTGGVVYAQYFTGGYYTNFVGGPMGGNRFEYNQADTNGYSISASATDQAKIEFSGSVPNSAVGNTTPLCNSNPNVTTGTQGCPTQ